jgi:MarR family transcriptional regulator, organic hydroperoxide resistance regulator
MTRASQKFPAATPRATRVKCLSSGTQQWPEEVRADVRGRTGGVVTAFENDEQDGNGVRAEIVQRRPFHSVKAELAVSILRTAALLERHFAQVVAESGVTVQQYNVLRILRGAGSEGLPTLVIRDRMIHAAPGITRLLDKLEKAGLARRERCSPDRRQVFCYITERGLAVLERLDEDMRKADETAAGNLTDAEQRQLLKLLEGVRAGQRRGDIPIDSALTDNGPTAAPTD